MTSKFDELMKYIDDESASYVTSTAAANNSKLENNSHTNNNVNHEQSTRKQSYIWDEDYQPEQKLSDINVVNNQLNKSSSSRKSSVTSHDTHNTRNTPSSSSSSSSHNSNTNNNKNSSNNNSSVSLMIKEIENKIKLMKDNIKKKTIEIQEYHEELIRLQNAIEKRQQKFKIIHEGQLYELKKEQSEALDQQNKVINKLNADIKDLSSKYNALLERQEQLVNTKNITVDKARKG
jgi:chromosome segregation ATPase